LLRCPVEQIVEEFAVIEQAEPEIDGGQSGIGLASCKFLPK